MVGSETDTMRMVVGLSVLYTMPPFFEGSDFAAKYIWHAIYTDLNRKNRNRR